MGYAKNITELIGNTPLVQLQKASNESGATVLGKCEFLNPTHSVKDRIGTNMINTALKEGLINKDTIVIEPTSGNTGIALASVCAALGIKLILTMPASMSIERRRLLQALGAKLVLTPPEKGMKGAIEKANELKEETPNSFIPQQFANKANPEIHRLTTAQEILKDTDGKIDIFIAAVGTGGTLTGTGEVLKAHNPNIKIIAVEPEASPV
ncbi:PLP-dependent cysteine synthase family protein, partial [Aliarcobacter butzleri]